MLTVFSKKPQFVSAFYVAYMGRVFSNYRSRALLLLRTPILEYSNVVWSGLTKADAERLERCNRAAARLISNIRPEEAVSHELILARAGLPTLSSRRALSCAMLSLKCIRTQLPKHLDMEIRDWLPEQTHKNRASRRPSSFRLPRPKKKNALKIPLVHSF